MKARRLTRRSRWLMISVGIHLVILLSLLRWQLTIPRVDEPSTSQGRELAVVSVSVSPEPPPPVAQIPSVEDFPAPDEEVPSPLSTPPQAPRGAAPSIGVGTGGGELSPPVPVLLTWPAGDGAPPDEESLISGEAIRRVLFRVHVTSEGLVSEVELLRGSLVSADDSVAWAAARALKFLPATREGKPVASWTTVEIGLGP